MFVMDYFFCLLMMFMVVGVMVLSMTLISYHGVISLMGFVFLCCVFMSIIGRTFVALVMYIVYLGGLIVVFGYCISVEKDRGVQSPASNFFMYFFVCAGVVVYLWIVSFLGVGGWLVEVNQDCFVCIGVNGFGVLYSSGGFGLIVCSWILFITLFSILVILSWYRRGGLRSF